MKLGSPKPRGQDAPTLNLDGVLGLETDEEKRDRRYYIYLLAVALFGWALASYDFNLLTYTINKIATDLHFGQTLVGLLFFIIYAAMLVISLSVGYMMDERGRRWMWQISLAGAAIFTGLTFFVQDFWQLAAVRAVASGLANSELAISITLVNEQLPARRRGFLYSIVQGGWPLGVVIAGIVWLALGPQLGWRLVFVLGVAPLFMVLAGRKWVRRSERWVQMRQVKKAKQEGNEQRVKELLDRYDVDIEEVEQITVTQIFSRPSWERTQLIKTSVVWLAYSASFVATNVYIVYWLKHFRGFSPVMATVLLLVASGGGYFFYVIGGWLGDRYGRQRLLIVSAFVALGLNILFFFLNTIWALWVVYFFLYQVTNGTWSGNGYGYWAESFPTRVRGTAIGWLGAMFTAGLMIGSGIWTVLIGVGPVITWWVVAVGLTAVQCGLVFILPHIPPGKQLEEVAT